MDIRWEVVILTRDLERRRDLAKILTTNEIDYACASSIEDCKEIVARESVGMIFWDGHLVEGACRDPLHAIRSLDRRVKIVLMCQSDDREKRDAIAQMGAFGVIALPCQPTDIEWVLSRAVREERLEGKSERRPIQPLHA